MYRYMFIALFLIAAASFAPGFIQDFLHDPASEGGQKIKHMVGKAQSEEVQRQEADYADGRLVLKADRMGQYHASVKINHKRSKMLVDTGASVVVLSLKDAKRMGYHPDPQDFKHPVNTANGRNFFAQVTLKTVEIGFIEKRNIRALIAPKDMLHTSLLGMSFLSQVKNLKMKSDQLILED